MYVRAEQAGGHGTYLRRFTVDFLSQTVKSVVVRSQFEYDIILHLLTYCVCVD